MPTTHTTRLLMTTTITRSTNRHIDVLIDSLADTRTITVPRGTPDPEATAVRLFCADLDPWHYTISEPGPGQFLLTVDVPTLETAAH